MPTPLIEKRNTLYWAERNLRTDSPNPPFREVQPGPPFIHRVTASTSASTRASVKSIQRRHGGHGQVVCHIRTWVGRRVALGQLKVVMHVFGALHGDGARSVSARTSSEPPGHRRRRRWLWLIMFIDKLHLRSIEIARKMLRRQWSVPSWQTFDFVRRDRRHGAPTEQSNHCSDASCCRHQGASEFRDGVQQRVVGQEWPSEGCGRQDV